MLVEHEALISVEKEANELDELIVCSGHGSASAVAEDEVGDVGDGSAPVVDCSAGSIL